MERVVQFETKRKTSPGFDMLAFYFTERWKMRKQASTGVAWLSSALGVSCRLKCHIERNSRPMLNNHWRRSRFMSGRKVGKTSGQHDPYTLGYTHPTMAKNNELQAGNGKLIS